MTPEKVVAEVQDRAEVANLASRPSPDSSVTGVMVVGVWDSAAGERTGVGGGETKYADRKRKQTPNEK